MTVPQQSRFAPVVGATPAEHQAQDLRSRYRAIRNTTLALAEPLSDEDCAIQSMPDCSPAKWHLAHTTWFFETFVLERELKNYRLFQPAFRMLFNSYYQSVGAQWARPQRGLLSRPGRAEVLTYRDAIDEQMDSLLHHGVSDATVARIELGLQHEQQHQELLLTDIKHLFSCNPLHPAYRESPPSRESDTGARREDASLTWHAYPNALSVFGHPGGGFAFDNEGPAHRAYLQPYALAGRLVTNAEYQAFVEAGAYRRPEWWLAAAWETVQARDWRAPLYWLEQDGEWLQHTLDGLQPLDPQAPVCHLSYYEADAYARYAGARLPTEYEWEYAAREQAIEGNFLESGALRPQPHTRAAREGPGQLYGDVWEWTASPYVAYPGYKPPAGALGEYNGKFMCNQLVLRGGSCLTPQSHIRPTYRNFFPAEARWQCSGLRLARDLG